MLKIIRGSKKIITTSCFFLLVISALFYSSLLNINKNSTAWQTTTNRHLAPEEDSKYLSQVTVAKTVGYDPTLLEEIELNKGSSLYKHMHSIVHNPELRRITVRLIPGARCPQPSLMGRLSGKSLSIIEWDRESFSTESISGKPTAVTGHYSVPFDGQYYIEIIVLYCKQIDDDNIATDLRAKCLEIPDYHRLTEMGASINVKIAGSGSSSRSVATANDQGYWEASISTPLYTRWQPQRCREENRAKEERCASRITLKPFEKYTFKWTPRDDDDDDATITIPPLKDVITTKADNYTRNCAVDDNEKCRICTVGASHSRRLYRYLEAIRVSRVGYFLYKHPREIDATAAREIMDTCPIVLLGFGQWSASFDGRYPPTSFRDQMRDMLQHFLDHPNAKNVHVTSVHLNPLGDIQTHCPTWDFRTPPVIERYNYYLKRLCSDMGVSFVDDGFITKPMWDSAEDWNHLSVTVQIIEAQYYAGRFNLL